MTVRECEHPVATADWDGLPGVRHPPPANVTHRPRGGVARRGEHRTRPAAPSCAATAAGVEGGLLGAARLRHRVVFLPYRACPSRECHYVAEVGGGTGLERKLILGGVLL